MPIYLDVSYQYRAQPVKLKEIIMQFKDHEGYLVVLNFAGKCFLMSQLFYSYEGASVVVVAHWTTGQQVKQLILHQRHDP